MYLNDDTPMPRDRIGDDTLRRMLDESRSCPSEPRTPSCNRPDAPIRNQWGLLQYPLASMYAPLQEFDNLYDRDTALTRGTLFSELDLPFMGATVTKGGRCRG